MENNVEWLLKNVSLKHRKQNKKMDDSAQFGAFVIFYQNVLDKSSLFIKQISVVWD